MSQEINNREYRQNVIRELLKQLHAGKSVEEVKAQFAEAFEGVSAAEISEAEQALISGGMPVTEVQRLCDVHAAVFKGSIEAIHQAADPSGEWGHPAYTLRMENRAIEKLMDTRIRPHLNTLAAQNDAPSRLALTEDLALLKRIDVHYLKKENLFFPYLEQYGVTAPPKVMWGVDDEIRALIKLAQETLKEYAGNAAALAAVVEEALVKIAEMIFKEENILLPMLLETLTQEEWGKIAEESASLGYCLISAPPAWKPQAQSPAEQPAAALDGAVRLPTGVLSVQEMTRLLDTLPIDITFVDADDTVKYFSESAERVFPRTRAIIGRKVVNCHPPASMHIVQGILDDFKAGKKEHEDFWIHMGGKYVFIRYFAVRDENGKYMGTLEVTQDIAPIQAIGGEKRLVSDS